ncbi:hypothetical protein CL614_01605 [archaeon]|nr:hypothetical protein [archaeon]
MERLGIVGKEAENPPKTIHETSAIIIEDGDKVLMIKRGNNPEKGTWAIPGGHVDEGETYSEAAQREAQEEVGDIETEKEPIFGFNHKQGSEKRMPMIHWHYGKLFRGKVVGKISASSDASEMEWINKNEIKNLELAKWAQTVFEKLGYLD